MEKYPNYKVSIETYCLIFRKENIGFDRPKQDECDICEQHKEHQCSAENNLCKICHDYDIHKTNYVEARKAYQNEKNTEWAIDKKFFAVDMEKVFILPKIKTKSSFFVSRLVVFNKTFATFRSKDENICVL